VLEPGNSFQALAEGWLSSESVPGQLVGGSAIDGI